MVTVAELQTLTNVTLHYASHLLTLEDQERWLTHHTLSEILQTQPSFAADVDTFEQLARSAWQEVRSAKRQYQVPSRGRAEIEVQNDLAQRFHLARIRFVQEGVFAPGITVRLKFRDPEAIAVMFINADGRIDGFHRGIKHEWFQKVLESMILTYYRDLVVPNDPDVSAPRLSHLTPSIYSGRTSGVAKMRPLPRIKPIRNYAKYTLDDWYFAQHRALHWVDGHVRYIGPHFSASNEKLREAEEAGVQLPPGWTWVREHARGDSDELQLDGVDLKVRTLFAAQRRASNELRRLLR